MSDLNLVIPFAGSQLPESCTRLKHPSEKLRSIERMTHVSYGAGLGSPNDRPAQTVEAGKIRCIERMLDL